jgi:hypothetical protein
MNIEIQISIDVKSKVFELKEPNAIIINTEIIRQTSPNNLLLDLEGLNMLSPNINNKIITKSQRIKTRKSSIIYNLKPILVRSFF